MAKGGFQSARRRRGLPIPLIAGVIILVVLAGALFFFAGQADKKRPALQEIRVEATNVGPK